MFKNHTVLFGAIAVTCCLAFPNFAMSQTIYLTTGNDTAVLEDDGIAGNGISQIRSTNGGFPTQQITHQGDLAIVMRNGDDSLTVDGKLDSQFAGALRLYGGNGATNIVVRYGFEAPDDLLCHSVGDLTASITNADIGAHLRVVDKAGFTDLTCYATQVGGNFAVTSTDGGSRIRIGIMQAPVRINGFLAINNQNWGDDEIDLIPVTVDGKTFINTGEGNCELSSLFCNFRDTVSVKSGGGIDSLLFGDCSVDGNLTIEPGQGESDTTLVQSSVTGDTKLVTDLGFDELNIFSFNCETVLFDDTADSSGSGSSVDVRILGGSPVPHDIGELRILGLNNELEVSGTGNGNIDLLLVDVANSYAEISGDTEITTLAVIADGSGYKSLYVEDDGVENAYVINTNTQAGTETVFTDAQVTGNVYVYNAGSATDYVRFDNSEIFGNTTVRTFGGDDIISLLGSGFDGLSLNAGNGFDVLEYSSGLYITGPLSILNFENFLFIP